METFNHIRDIDFNSDPTKPNFKKWIIPGPGFIMNRFSDKPRNLEAISSGGDKFTWTINQGEICPVKVKEIVSLDGGGCNILW